MVFEIIPNMENSKFGFVRLPPYTISVPQSSKSGAHTCIYVHNTIKDYLGSDLVEIFIDKENGQMLWKPTANAVIGSRLVKQNKNKHLYLTSRMLPLILESGRYTGEFKDREIIFNIKIANNKGWEEKHGKTTPYEVYKGELFKIDKR